MNNSLSEKQQNVLDYLRYSIAKKGYIFYSQHFSVDNNPDGNPY